MNEDEEIGQLASSLYSEIREQTEDWVVNAYLSIITAGRSIEALANSLLRKYHINQSSLGILYLLMGNGGSITQKRLGEILGDSRQAVAWTLSSIEKRGLVTRSLVRSDQRKRIVKITRKGLKLAADVMLLEERESFISNLMSVLNQRQAKQLTGNLRRVTRKSREETKNYIGQR